MKLRILSIVAALFAVTTLFAQQKSVKVNSLEELLPVLKQSNQSVVMTPGTYRVTAKDIKAGKFPDQSEVTENSFKNVLLLLTGNDNTFDFSGVTLEVETAVFNSFGNKNELHDLHVLGSRNVVKNLKIQDIGKETDAPRYGCTNIVVDGANNRLEGVELRSTGSSPYGYGEIFGKGRVKTMGLRKHSALLVRGDYNHLLNCKVYHFAFGHFIFMQSAKCPTIEGCYVEGKMNTTDNILKEAGTGSAADKIEFKTIYGYKAPKGYTLALGEDGIRTYNRGATMVDGVRLTRGTNDVTVKNCVVKHARGGVALTLSTGERIVENVTLIGCQGGFNVGSGGKIINCRADAAFGPALTAHYEKDKNLTAEITIMPYEGEKYVGNGSKQVVHLIGTGHNVTLHRGEGLKEDKDMEITIGGDRRTVGELAEVSDYTASGITLVNETNYQIKIGEKATNNKISTKGKVEDKGSANTITKL
ncbi:MAG: hypothetical protein SNH35_08855 [Rikenellaceae bacterium]